MENVPHWVWITMAGIMGLAWIIVTWINNSCKHQWENVGQPCTVTYWSANAYGQRIRDSDFKTTVQPVRCTKCGKNTSHTIADC